MWLVIFFTDAHFSKWKYCSAQGPSLSLLLLPLFLLPSTAAMAKRLMLRAAVCCLLLTTYLLFSFGKVKGKAGKAEQRMLCLQIQVYLHTSIIPLYCLLTHRSCTLEFVDDFLPQQRFTPHTTFFASVSSKQQRKLTARTMALVSPPPSRVDTNRFF